jgi:hypothetical protein
MKDKKEETNIAIPKSMAQELIHEFEVFAGILKGIDTFSEAPTEKRKDFLRHVSNGQNRIEAHFKKTARSFGLSCEQFCELIGDSKNYEPEDWEALQAVKNGNRMASTQKEKKASKNLKI